MRNLCIDLFCGLGGWAEGFLAEGYDVVGFDIERHDYGTGGYPGQLVLQNVLQLDGRQFRSANVIVASPPCQEYSYMAMPWKPAKAKAKWYREEVTRQLELNCLFNSCFRIAHEAQVPLIVENVKGAQPWVGRAKAHFGSFYLWGDVNSVGGAVAVGDMKFAMPLLRPRGDGVKVPSMSWSGMDSGNKGFAKRLGGSEHSQSGSNSAARKESAARIAKIPFPLANYVARMMNGGQF
jgi:hypothetical protein